MVPSAGAPAPVTSALMALAFFIFGGLSARALASGFAAKPPVLVMAKAGKVAVGLGAKLIGGMVIHGVLQLWGRPV